MTPTSFDFTVTLTGDARMVSAITALTAHAAGYAQLTAGAAEGLTSHVARATETVLAGAPPGAPAVEFHFAGGEDALVVTISGEVAPSTPTPASTVSGDVSVDWSRDGSRHTCFIRHKTPA